MDRASIDPVAKTVLHAGRFRMAFVAGRLQWISVGAVEAVRRIYFAFRDPNWTTVPFEIDEIDARVGSDRFALSYTATARSESGDFRITCSMEGSPDDVLEVRLWGEALTRVAKNRIGLCLHYPHELAGHPLRYRQSTDPTERPDMFPTHIAARQPLLGLGAISHRVSDQRWCRASFYGDLWEMEDQRNFSDASFKVYSTPAEDPVPVVLEAGETIEQRIVIVLVDEPEDPTGAAVAASAGAGAELYLGAAALATLASQGGGGAPGVSEVDVEVGVETMRRVPALGTDISQLCALEDAFPRSIEAVRSAAASAVRALHLAHMRLEVDVGHARWRHHLACGLELAAATDAMLEVVLTDTEPSWPEGLAQTIAEHVDRIASVCIAASGEDAEVVAAKVEGLRGAIRAAGADVALGSGTAGWFVELNQADLPGADLDFLAYSLTPQVHAFDDDILRENLHGPIDQLASAHRLAHGGELHVGPVTLRPTGTEAGATDALWPTPRDPRLDSSFGAVWTLGAIAAHAQGGAATLTLFEAYGAEAIATERAGGDGGLAIRTVVRELAGLRDRAVLDAGTSSPLACVALAVRVGDGACCYLANLDAVPVQARVRLPEPAREIAAGSMASTETQTEPVWRSVPADHGDDGTWSVNVEPYGVTRLHWTGGVPHPSEGRS